jgi:L-amino acid N-acyltransferase YncA
MIRDMLPTDQNAVLCIYQQGLDSRNATFETVAPDWVTWDTKHHSFGRFVYCVDGDVVAWAALSPTSPRHCYRGVAEVSIYVEDDFQGRGIGSTLLEILVSESERSGIWTLQSSVFPENVATANLHKKNGFIELGIRRRVAQLDEQWRDTLILERRSTTVGQ